MTAKELDRLKRLSDEWMLIWRDDKYPRGMKRTVGEMDKRKIAHHDYKEYCVKHFHEVLDENERLRELVMKANEWLDTARDCLALCNDSTFCNKKENDK